MTTVVTLNQAAQTHVVTLNQEGQTIVVTLTPAAGTADLSALVARVEDVEAHLAAIDAALGLLA